MDDKPSQEEPKKDFNKLDLTQLESFSFGTEWSKDKAEPDSGSNRRDDRPRRDGGPDDRRDRRGFKRSSGPPSGGGRGAPGGGGRDRRPGGDRPQRGEGQGRGGHGGPRGGDRRGGGRPPMEGPYISPHFEATFYPEDVSFAALAKTIRSSARTFELFDIAKTVIGKHDRFVVVLDRKPNSSKEKETFYVCLLDGIPFESEDAAINHVVQKHLPRFFAISEEACEPPKGSFQVINRCGVTGELLGPPNYHLYNQIVQQHHASRLSRMSFDNFSSRIETVRDEEVVAQWLESMKTVTRYTWLGDENVPVKPPEVYATSKPDAAPAATEPTASSEPEASAPTDAAVEATPETSADDAGSTDEPPATDTPEDASETDTSATAEEPVTDTETESAAAEAPAETPAAAPQPSFASITEAKVYLITRARDKCVRTYEHGRFHGRAISDMPDGEIKRAVLGALERQQRFPLDTANALRGRLRREGFTIFKKGSKGISYVSAVKRKFRVAGQTFADSINDLITFIEENPMVKVSELTEKFLKIAPPEQPKTEGEAPTAVAPGTVSPFGEADQPRIKRMQVDLRWLVTEGYVTEFIDGSLFAAPPMPSAKPKPEAKPKGAPEPKESSKAETESSVPAEPEATTPAGSPESAAPVDSPAPTPVAEPAAPANDAPVEPEAAEKAPAPVAVQPDEGKSSSPDSAEQSDSEEKPDGDAESVTPPPEPPPAEAEDSEEKPPA